MTKLHMITDKDVFKVQCTELAEGKYVGEKFLIEVYDDRNSKTDIFEVGFTTSLLGTDLSGIDPRLPNRSLSKEEKCLFGVRAARVFGHRQEGKEGIVSVGRDNFENLTNQNVGDDEIHRQIIPLVVRFFKKYPYREFVSPQDLFVSTEFNLDKIIDRLDYLEQRGFIVSAAAQRGAPYRLAPGGLEKLEHELSSLATMPKIENRYFKLVNISIDTSRPFVFVLMPFKNDEFKQSHYFDVIKPTIENELKLQCIRSDEITDPGVINDQIYTGIAKAMVVIAEVTTQNPNVFYELGLAHSLDKDVFIFTQRDAKKLPFDISTVRAQNYDSKEELKEKIISCLTKHLDKK